MRDGGQGARISFPQALPLANRCCCGSDARFYCQRPDCLRVPKSKYRHTRLRVSCQRPDWLQVPNSKHRHNRLRVSKSEHSRVQALPHLAPRHRRSPSHRMRRLAPLSGRVLHSVSYGANALFAGVGQRSTISSDELAECFSLDGQA